MLLDCVLEKFVRLCAERSDLGSKSPEELMGMAEMLLKNGWVAS